MNDNENTDLRMAVYSAVNRETMGHFINRTLIVSFLN